jgi:hypothetical protein
MEVGYNISTVALPVVEGNPVPGAIAEPPWGI